MALRRVAPTLRDIGWRIRPLSDRVRPSAFREVYQKSDLIVTSLKLQKDDWNKRWSKFYKQGMQKVDDESTYIEEALEKAEGMRFLFILNTNCFCSYTH